MHTNCHWGEGRKGRRSSALIITMLLVSLIAIMLVGFVGSMRSEIFSARYHLNGVKASFYAQAAQDQAISKLYYLTSSTNYSWVTMPGRAYRWTKGQANQSGTRVELSSNPDSTSYVLPITTAPDATAADINVKRLDGNGNLVTSANLPMRVQWVYVHQDGTFDTTTNAPAVVGRFAFWIDDESAKVNVNTAWTNNPAYPGSYPGRVNLSLLSTDGSFPDAIHNFRTNANYHFFNSLGEYSQDNSYFNTTNNYQTNRFSITHYSHALDWNMFNEPRILLTTKQAVAQNIVGSSATPNYIQITQNPGSDPGNVATLSSSLVNAAVDKISAQLKRTDWPFMSAASSFETKYAAGRPVKPAQIALNIIEYVRAAESTNSIIEPIMGSVGSTGAFDMSSSSSALIMGNNRGPRINELGVVVATTSSSGKYNVVVKAEVHLPQYFGTLNSVSSTLTADLSTLSLSVYLAESSNRASLSAQITGTTSIAAGGYATVSTTVPLALTTARASLSALSVAAFLVSSSGAYVDAVPVGFLTDTTAASNMISCPVDSTATGPSKSMGVNDPCVNRNRVDWAAQTASFGAVNAVRSFTTTVSGVAQQDRTSSNSGNLTDVGIRMPAPASGGIVTVNTLGLVGSVGELGFVHTGTECEASTGGVPWRTIRLQPSDPTATSVPDWALLDLFSAPVTVSRTGVEAPYMLPTNETNSIGGKVNVNTIVSSVTNSTSFKRPLPLMSVFFGALSSSSTLNTLTTTTASNIMTYINTQSFSSTISSELYGAGFYYAPGQIVEVRGVADLGEASEARARDALSMLTARGNVFTIYTVGQVVKLDSSGTVNVLSEQRRMIMVERIQSGNSGKFQIVFSQNLSP